MDERQLIEAILSGKPYFGPALRAFQGEPLRHGFMTALVELLARHETSLPIDILEVGSWAGGSALTWAAALRRFGLAGRIVCVDPWQAYFDTQVDAAPVYHEMNAAAEDGLIYKLFLHNIRSAGVGDLVVPMKGRSRDLLPTLRPESFAVVFLDGSHRYEDVAHDIQSATPLVRVGGILCGDDLELLASEIALDELAEAAARGIDYTRHQASGYFYHPGVTKAVGEAFARPSRWDGFWAVRKANDGWEPVDLTGCGVTVPTHLQHLAKPKNAVEATVRLVEAYRQFNLVDYGGKLCAVQQHLGEIPWSEGYEALLVRFKNEDFFSGSSLTMLRRRIDEILAEQEHIRQETLANVPVLVLGSYRGFNIVGYKRQFWAVRLSVGIVDWEEWAQLAERYGEQNFFAGPSAAAVQERIDAIVATEQNVEQQDLTKAGEEREQEGSPRAARDPEPSRNES